MNVDVLPEIDVLQIVNNFSECFLNFLSDLKRCATSDVPGSDDLKAKFLAETQKVIGCRIEELPPEAGAFVLIDGILVFNSEPIVAILFAVLDDVKNQMARGLKLEAGEIEKLQQDVFIVYALHELRHVTQGLALKSSVDKIKQISGSQKVAEFDLQADCDAVFAYAMVRSGSGQGSQKYFDSYKEGLLFSSQYFFKAFDFSKNRTDKLARVIGIVLMQAHFAIVEIGQGPFYFSPDIPIFVDLDKNREMNLYIKYPDESYLGTISSNDNEKLLHALNCRAYDEALVEGINVIRTLKSA